MGKAKVIVSGVAWTVINNVVSILYGIISVPFLIQYFGKDEYGLIGLALSINVYIQLLDMGMANTNVRFFSEFITLKDENRVQKLFSLTSLLYLVIGLLNTIIIFGLSFVVEEIFSVTSDQAITLRNLLWILAFNAIFSWASVCYDQFLKAHEMIDWLKKRSIFLKLMQFVVLFLTIILRLSIESYFLMYIFMATIILPLTIIKTKKVAPRIKINLNFDKATFIAIFPYALSIFSFSIFQFLAFNFRPLFLGNMSGPGAVAEYSIMNAIASVVAIISGSFIQVLMPIVTKMAVHSDKGGIDNIVYNGTKYATILITITVFALVVANKELITLYVGTEYASLSKWLVIWLLTLLLSHRNIMTSVVFTEKKLKSVAIMGGIAMVLAIASYMIYIPKYGVGGVVIGFAVHELTHTLFYYVYFLPKRLHINTFIIFSRSVIPTWIIIGGACVVISGLPLPAYNTLLWPCLIKILSFTIISGILSWFILLNDNDRHMVFSLLR